MKYCSSYEIKVNSCPIGILELDHYKTMKIDS